MLKCSSLLGMAVHSDDGKRIGEIVSIDYQAEKKVVAGIIVNKNGLFSKNVYVPYSDICSIGTSVIVSGNGYRTSGNDYIFNGNMELKAKLTDTEFGYISEIAFDEKSGEVEFLEVSRSFWEDFKIGRQKIVSKISNVIDTRIDQHAFERRE